MFHTTRTPVVAWALLVALAVAVVFAVSALAWRTPAGSGRSYVAAMTRNVGPGQTQPASPLASGPSCLQISSAMAAPGLLDITAGCARL